MILLIGCYVVSIGFIVLSVYLYFWRDRRKFYRRNVAGLEEFKSYKNMLLTSYKENFVQFLYIFLAIIGTIILLAVIFDGHTIKQINHW